MKHQLSAEDRAALLRQHLDDGVPLGRISSQAGIPLRTLQRWTARFRAGGSVEALGRRPRSDRGSRSLPPEIVGAIEGLALRRPSVVDPAKLAYATHLRDQEDLSISEIVQATGITRSSLYRHLPPRPPETLNAENQQNA